MLLSAFCSTHCERQKFSLRVSQVNNSIYLSAKYRQKNLDCEERSFMPDSPKRVKSWRLVRHPREAPKLSHRCWETRMGSKLPTPYSSGAPLFQPHAQQPRLWGLLGVLRGGRNTLPLLRLLRGGPDTHTHMLQAWLNPCLGLLASAVVQSPSMPRGLCFSRSMNLPVSIIHLPQLSGLLRKVLNLPGLRGNPKTPGLFLGVLDLIFCLVSGVA